MDQLIHAPGQQIGYDATGPYWVVGLIWVLAGRIQFMVDEKLLDAPGPSFVMVMPPRSVVSAVLKDAKTINSAAFSRTAPPREISREAIMFPIDHLWPLQSFTDVSRLLRQTAKQVVISRCSQPHRLSKELKDRLESTFDTAVRISDLAKQLGIAAARLSRLFRRDWGKPPIQFRNWLRVTEAFRHLAEHKAVTDVAFDAGFDDLSRFHKQFKRIIGRTPGAIQKGSKNAKAP